MCCIGIHDLMHKDFSGATELLLQVYAQAAQDSIPGCVMTVLYATNRLRQLTYYTVNRHF